MSGEVVHGFWVVVLHGVGELLLYSRGSSSKVKVGMPEHEIKTAAIANNNRLVFGQAAHIERMFLGVKGAIDVKHASTVRNTPVGLALDQVMTGIEAVSIDSVLPDNRLVGESRA